MKFFPNYIFSVLVIALLLNGLALKGQDAHFTQYYQVPAYVNPALVGNFNGLFKVGMNYRDQWRPALDRPYATFTATGESKFLVGQRDPDVAALGIMFFSDRISKYDLNTTQIALTGSYHKLLDKKTKQYIGLGYQAAIFQKSLNYEDLTFGDQFNAIDAYSNETLEILPGNNLGFFDMSLGVDYSYTSTSNKEFNAGISVFHLTSPNISFFAQEDPVDKDLNINAVLDPRWSAHASYSLPTSDAFSFQTRALFMSQDQHKLYVLSTLFTYNNPKSEGKKFYFGPAFRFSNRLDKTSLEAIMLTIGYDFKGLNLGLSYDYNTNDLFNDRYGMSTFEVSINYFGQYENADAFCPTF
ncbi:MAG: PorP/SprF family type IX secretion system membrane protein [Saprospiraceae bacterium]|nr:PorP/SprF family type IX secretion system membrane protein [Saprospiraceae bacterium]MBK7222531.1 PorP/SprF family type IX secretion system membrane protein [Saprospiraceae bacterium]MBK7789162.1 PorP/SprF family type IX secretion system membrane protein [Saprospiraceae bacterium]MBK9689466.1 PorP/SprF family type IX secretion system membrane protein [Saprospiraceae bacterium]